MDGIPDKWVGQSLPRFEDAALLTGRGRYFDDCGTPPSSNPLMLILYNSHNQNTPSCQV